MACRLFDTNPLHELMLIYCPSDPEVIFSEILITNKKFYVQGNRMQNVLNLYVTIILVYFCLFLSIML